MLKELVPGQWKTFLENELITESSKKLDQFLEHEYKTKTIFPEPNEIFRALQFCPPQGVKVVIIGQDPYHGENQAHGLSFSIPKSQIKLPPSLKNIRKEIEQSLNLKLPEHGNLENWASQGVLLLNAVLTVEKAKAASHQKKGWEQITDSLIKSISQGSKGVVFFLWGAYAQKKESLIDASKHLVLMNVHPSPLSAHRGFFGKGHFQKANEYLKSQQKEPINWSY